MRRDTTSQTKSTMKVAAWGCNGLAQAGCRGGHCQVVFCEFRE